jgi:hypothetical protein
VYAYAPPATGGWRDRPLAAWGPRKIDPTAHVTTHFPRSARFGRQGTTITIGNDVMFASANQVRADDGHPVSDARSGNRVSVSRSIHIGHHVWLARHAVVLGRTVISYGSRRKSVLEPHRP